jgi:hypothetical protein
MAVTFVIRNIVKQTATKVLLLRLYDLAGCRITAPRIRLRGRLQAQHGCCDRLSGSKTVCTAAATGTSAGKDAFWASAPSWSPRPLSDNLMCKLQRCSLSDQYRLACVELLRAISVRAAPGALGDLKLQG